MKKTLIISGIVSFILGGLVGFVWRAFSANALPINADYTTKKPISWQNYQELIVEYNKKIDWIKTNCDTDKRCQKSGKEKKVIFEGIETKQDIAKKLNQWLKESNNLYSK